jgi:3-hydroxyacyl-[acyl-carrier-protein] dehydratase
MTTPDALAALPHGPSFRFVDELTALTPGQSGTGTYLVRGDEAFLAGHFPGQPLMPGVILIEALAQLGGVVAQSDPAIPALADLKLTAVRGAKITGSAVPGEILTLRAEVAGRMGGLVQIQGEVKVDERVILTAQVTLSGTAPG